jgi:DNA-binding MarR family transcriptional regulator
MKYVDPLFQEYSYEVLQVLLDEEEGFTFEVMLGKIAKLVKKPREDLDTGHRLVKVVYELAELGLIEKRDPDMYVIGFRGISAVQTMTELSPVERQGLADPAAVQVLDVISKLPKPSIYRLKSRVSPSDLVEPMVDRLHESGLIEVTESPMETHKLVELTGRGEAACQVMEQLEEKMRVSEPKTKRKITF